MTQYSVIDQNTLMYTLKLKDLSVAVCLFNVSVAGIFILFRREPKKCKNPYNQMELLFSLPHLRDLAFIYL